MRIGLSGLARRPRRAVRGSIGEGQRNGQKPLAIGLVTTSALSIRDRLELTLC